MSALTEAKKVLLKRLDTLSGVLSAARAAATSGGPATTGTGPQSRSETGRGRSCSAGPGRGRYANHAARKSWVPSRSATDFGRGRGRGGWAPRGGRGSYWGRGAIGRGSFGWGRGRGRGASASAASRTAGAAAAGKVTGKSGAKMTGMVRLQGTLYAVSSDKRTLRRRSAGTGARTDLKSKLAGQIAAAQKVTEARQRESAVVTNRRRHASAVLAQSRLRTQRSRLLRGQPKKQKFCMFFNLFGKCDRIGKGCPYSHDQAKVAVCRRFLQGACHADPCPLSHKVAPEKMPVCVHFLRGVCGRVSCPYLHVKVGKDAPICPQFRKGFCPAGAACPKRHVFEKGAAVSGEAADRQRAVVQIDEEEVEPEMRPPAAFVRLWKRSKLGGVDLRI